MGSGRKSASTNRKGSIRPATSPETRINRLVSKAFDLVEQRLDDGTATSQETTALIKLGSEEQKLKLQKLETENNLMQAKIKALESQQHAEELYERAIAAFARYNGYQLEEVIDEEVIR